MSHSDPSVEPVSLGINTAEAQYGEVTPFSAIRELADNAMGIGLKMGNTKVAVDVSIQDVNPGTEGEYRMLTVAMTTKYEDGPWRNTCGVIQPEKGENKAHIMQNHNWGTLNALIGLGQKGEDGRPLGQMMVVRREAREGTIPDGVYPVKMSILRCGTHADDEYHRQNPGKGKARGTMRDEVLVYRDLVKDTNYRWSGAVVSSDTVAPKNPRDFDKEVANYVAKTGKWLEGTKWERATGAPLVMNSMMDGFLKDQERALEKLAMVTKQDKEKVLSGDAVLYNFWPVRDEIVVDPDGTIRVGDKPAHELMRDTYLPCDSPVRHLLDQSKKPMPDPRKMCLTFGSHAVKPPSHWLSEAVKSGFLVPVRYDDGEGKFKNVISGDNFLVESYMRNPSEFSSASAHKPKPLVLWHSRGGLAIGAKEAFFEGASFLNAPAAAGVVRAMKDLFNHVCTKSMSNATTGGDLAKTLAIFRSLPPEEHKWEEQEVEDCIKGMEALCDLYQQKDKVFSANNDAATKELAEYMAANNNTRTRATSETEYRLSSLKGGDPLHKILLQIFHIVAGSNMVHLVTVLNPDMPLDKSKATILGDSKATTAALAELQRCNLKAMLGEVRRHQGWHKKLVAEIALAKKEEREKAAAEEAAKKKKKEEQRETAAKNAATLQQQKEDAKVKKAREEQIKKMKTLGCYPKQAGAWVEVQSFPAGKAAGRSPQVDTVAKYREAELETLLRKGELTLPSGLAVGKRLIFAGADPTQGTLFKKIGKAKCLGTDIIVNLAPPNQPHPAPASRPAPPPPRSAPAPAAAAKPSKQKEPVSRQTRVTSSALVKLAAANKPAKAPESLPEFKFIFVSVSGGVQTPLTVCVPPEELEVTEMLQSGMEDAQLEDFFKAVRASPDLWACFKDDGGMQMPAPFHCSLRVVPVFTRAPINGDLVYQTEEVLRGPIQRQVVVYLNVPHMLADRPANTMRRDEFKTTWLTMKIAEAVTLSYAGTINTKVGASPGANFAKSLMGMMLVGGFDHSEVTAINAYKRKARSTSSGAESSSSSKRIKVHPSGAAGSSSSIVDMDGEQEDPAVLAWEQANQKAP